MATVGVISDTHGLLRPQALAAMRGCSPILHAGDIGGIEVVDELRKIAPVFAVRGNNDRGEWAKGIPGTDVVEVDGFSFYLLHDVNELDLDPRAAGFRAVIAGHSHRPRIEEKEGVLYFNPGSAGPRRFKLPVSVGRLIVTNDKLQAEIIELDV
jgi:putative phosphoesterase